MLGPANGLTDVAKEKVDMGRCIVGGGPGGGANPNCDPLAFISPPNILRFVIIVLRGAVGIMP